MNFQSLIFSFALIGLSYLLGEVPFGQIMETTPNKNLETFYKLGAFKFNNKILEMPVSVILEQDKKKYYCLTLKMPDGQSIFIEKYPTLAEANERLIELKKIFPK